MTQTERSERLKIINNQLQAFELSVGAIDRTKLPQFIHLLDHLQQAILDLLAEKITILTILESPKSASIS